MNSRLSYLRTRTLTPTHVKAQWDTRVHYFLSHFSKTCSYFTIVLRHGFPNRKKVHQRYPCQMIPVKRFWSVLIYDNAVWFILWLWDTNEAKTSSNWFKLPVVVLPLNVPMRFFPCHPYCYVCLVPYCSIFTSVYFICVRKCVCVRIYVWICE